MKKIIALIIIGCILCVGINMSYKRYISKNRVAEYVMWCEEKYQRLCTQDNDIIAYIDEKPIFIRDLEMYMLDKSIDSNYFQDRALENAFKSDEIIMDAFENVVLDNFYCLWCVKEGLEIDNEELKNKIWDVLLTESKSKVPNISAKAQIRLKQNIPFQLWFDAQCAEELVWIKFYPDGVENLQEIGDYKFELLNTEAAKYKIEIHSKQFQCLSSAEMADRLRLYGFAVGDI